MNDSVRPASGFTSGPSASAPFGVLATIPNPPPEVARLPAGTAVRGVVVGEDGHGHVLVRTELGTLSVATRAHLAPDTEVILQLRSSGAQLHVLIMQARNQLPTGRVSAAPPPSGEAPAPTAGGSGAAPNERAATGAAQGPPPSGLSPLGPPDRLSLGQSVRAVVQGPPAGPGPGIGAAAPASVALAPAAGPRPGAGLSPLPPGTALRLRILSISPPTAASPAGLAARQAAAGPDPVLGAVRLAGAATGPNPAQRIANGGAGNTATMAAPTPTPGAPGAPLATQGAVAPGGARPAGLAPGGTPGAAIVSGTAVASGAPGGSQVPFAGPAGPGPAGAGGANPPGAAVAATGQVPTAPSSAPQAAPATAQTATKAGPASGTGVPAASANTPALPAAGPQVFAGQVTGATHAGHPVVSTPLGTLTLEMRANLPVGGRVVLELPAEGLPAGAATDGRLAVPRSLGHAWPALEQALELLRDQPGPSGSGSAVPQTVPQPGPKLASGILFVLAALTGGNVSGWLGAETVQILRTAGRGGLVERMTRDLGQMGRMADGVGGDWRLLPIPLWDGDQVRQLRLFLRQRDQRQGGKARAEREATRFILELEMSRLGEMQFDGLVRAKRFDLMLRTRAPLPQPMRLDIRQIFQDANDAAGYTGSLGFQASRDWRFVPVEQSGGSTAESSLVV